MSKILGSHIPTQIENLAINGSMDFWQRVSANTTTVNTATSAGAYTADMVQYGSSGSTVKNYSVVRSTDVPSQAQSGFKSTYSYLFTMLTGISSFAASDQVLPFRYAMEGNDYQKIHNKSVTYGFWTKASIAGTYSFTIRSSAASRTYVTTFAVNGSNTWEYKTITVLMDSAAGYNFDTNIGILVEIGNVAGSTGQTATLGSWQAGLFYAASTGTNWMATTNATFQVAQFSIVEGPLGFSATGFTRAGDTIADEFVKCQRYCETLSASSSALGIVGFIATAGAVRTTYFYKVTKRANPTFFSGNGTWVINSAAANTNVAAANVTAEVATVDFFEFQLATSGQTAGQACSIGISVPGTAFIGFDSGL